MSSLAKTLWTLGAWACLSMALAGHEHPVTWAPLRVATRSHRWAPSHP